MPYTKAHAGEAESVLPDNVAGEMWMLKDELGAENLGFTFLSLEADEETKPHTHVEENLEEIYFVVEGGVDVVFDDGHREHLDEHEAIHITPEEERQIQNHDEYSELVLASAPVEE